MIRPRRITLSVWLWQCCRSKVTGTISYVFRMMKSTAHFCFFGSVGRNFATISRLYSQLELVVFSCCRYIFNGTEPEKLTSVHAGCSKSACTSTLSYLSRHVQTHHNVWTLRSSSAISSPSVLSADWLQPSGTLCHSMLLTVILLLPLIILYWKV